MLGSLDFYSTELNAKFSVSISANGVNREEIERAEGIGVLRRLAGF